MHDMPKIEDDNHNSQGKQQRLSVTNSDAIHNSQTNADNFGDTTLLVVNMDQGRDLAEAFSERRIVLMRGHGFAAAGRSLSEVVRLSVMLPRNAKILTTALQFGGLQPLRPGEIALRQNMNPDGKEFYRAWEYWVMRTGYKD